MSCIQCTQFNKIFSHRTTSTKFKILNCNCNCVQCICCSKFPSNSPEFQECCLVVSCKLLQINCFLVKLFKVLINLSIKCEHPAVSPSNHQEIQITTIISFHFFRCSICEAKLMSVRRARILT